MKKNIKNWEKFLELKSSTYHSAADKANVIYNNVGLSNKFRRKAEEIEAEEAKEFDRVYKKIIEELTEQIHFDPFKLYSKEYLISTNIEEIYLSFRIEILFGCNNEEDFSISISEDRKNTILIDLNNYYANDRKDAIKYKNLILDVLKSYIKYNNLLIENEYSQYIDYPNSLINEYIEKLNNMNIKYFYDSNISEMIKKSKTEKFKL